MHPDYHFKIIHHWDKDDPFLGLRLVEFSITDLCNRKCAFCPHVDETVFPNSNVYMEESIVESVIEDLVKHNFKGGIVFGGYGEPTLHKNICNLIKIASKHFPVQLFTNGDKIFDSNWYTIDDFVEAGLQSMYIGMYDDLNQVNDRLPTILSYSDKIKIEIFRAYELSPNGGIIFVNRAGSVLNKQYLNTPCFIPHTKAYIDWDGDLQLCANDWTKTGGLGNVKQTPFSTLWKSVKLKNEIRRKLLTDRTKAGGPCSTCNEYQMAVNENFVKAIWTPFLEDNNS
jgi:MoaA/NifB/PqqE/SkfB family radical SAM enzyme